MLERKWLLRLRRIKGNSFSRKVAKRKDLFTRDINLGLNILLRDKSLTSCVKLLTH